MMCFFYVNDLQTKGISFFGGAGGLNNILIYTANCGFRRESPLKPRMF